MTLTWTQAATDGSVNTALARTLTSPKSSHPRAALRAAYCGKNTPA